MPQVSLIIPVYNVSKYLPACLDSVINQTYKDFECICVNDGSTDNSLSILEEYAKRDKRIVVISQDNKGLSGARNSGLQVVTAPYFQFLDSDDMLHPRALEILYNAITRNDADFVQCRHVRVHENFHLERPATLDTTTLDTTPFASRYTVSYSAIDDFFAVRENCQVMAWLKMCKTEMFQNITFPVEVCTSMEDVVWTIKVLLVAKSAAFIPQQLVYYRYRSDSIMGQCKVKVPQAYTDSHLRAGEILHQEISNNQNITCKQRNILQQYIMRKLFHPVKKIMRKVPNGLDKNEMLTNLKQRLVELEKRGVFVISDLRLADKLAATSFLHGRLWLAKAIVAMT